MRQILMLGFLALTLSFTSAFAEDAASLKQNMKQANVIFKAVGASLNDVSKNPDNAQSMGQFVELFQQTLQQVPDVVKELPEAQRAPALDDYQKMIQQEIDFGQELQKAFLSNNNSLAAEIFQKMKELKQDGHDKYNP
jgi:predicted metalloendopeptidase